MELRSSLLCYSRGEDSPSLDDMGVGGDGQDSPILGG